MNEINYLHIFNIEAISNELKLDMIQKNIWSKDAPLDIYRLKILTLSYIDFENIFHNDGKMIVLDVLANDVIKIFRKLLEIKFPIDKIKLINDYNGNDDLSMSDNNSSCFNARKITGESNWSIHAYGAAIDINPLQNPYIKNNILLPKNSMSYSDRLIQKPGMVEDIVNIFDECGFDDWGGNWQQIKGYVDYMHFAVKF